MLLAGYVAVLSHVSQLDHIIFDYYLCSYYPYYQLFQESSVIQYSKLGAILITLIDLRCHTVFSCKGLSGGEASSC